MGESAGVGLTFLIFASCGALVQSQDPLIVRWNDSVLITNSTDLRELIYHDEIVMRTSGFGAPPDGPGILICRVSTSDSSAGWRRPDDTVIATGNFNDDFIQYRTTSSNTRVQLARTRDTLLDGASNNGLWTCGGGGYPPHHVPLYARGNGAVIIDSLSLGASPSFSNSSPRFTLIADTSGGPPTTFSWRNDAGTISNGGSNSISIEVNPNNDATGRMNCHYRSTLEVTAVAPGTYTYVASNRVTSGDARMAFIIEGGDSSNLQVTGTGSNAVQLTWDPPPGPPSGGYRVVDSGNSIDMTTTSTSLTIDMLPPGVYNFRVTAISQHFPGGTVGPRAVTITGAALAPVITLSPLTATSVTVSWTQSVLSIPVTSYGVAIWRLTDCNSVLSRRGPRNQAASDMTEVFEGLSEYIDYRAEVTAYFQSASSVRAELNFTTFAIAPSEVPSNVIHATTSRTISVSWDAIDCGNQNGPNFRYDVEFLQMDGISIPAGIVNNLMFTVMGLLPFTNYTFRVRGVNDAGNGGYTSLRIIQTNGEAPAVPSNVRVGTVTSRTISVFWNAISPNGPNFRYDVDFQQINGEATPDGIISNEMFTVMGLQPFVNYTFQVRGINDAGIGGYTSLMIILTTGEIPEVPDNVRVGTITSRTISVSWDVISPNGANFRYDVDFQRIGGGDAPVGIVNNEMFTVMRLLPFTNYTFRVRGVNDAGNGDYTSLTTIQTMGEAPEVPDNVRVVTLTSRTISVSWDAVNPNDANFRYNVDFQRMDGGAVPDGTIDNEMFTVMGLQPFINYTFRVRGVNDAGNGGYTSLRTIQTNGETPEVPSNVRIGTVTSRSISVSWDAISPSGANFRYEVDVQLESGGMVPIGTVDSEMITVMGLLPYTNYVVRVRGVNDVGNGDYTSPRTIQTTAEAPEVPSNVQVSSTSRTITVTWNAVDPYGPNFRYDVNFQRNDGGVVPVGTVNNVMFTVDNLQPFTNYTFRVRGVNDAGNGDYTNFIVIETNREVRAEVPSNVRVSAVSSRSISVSWDATDSGNQNFFYEVEFQQMDEGAVPVGTVINALFTVEGLQPFTNYTFRVRGVNEVGNGDYTSLIVIQTDQDKPGAIFDLETRLTSYTSVFVTWSPPQEPNGIIIMYELTYRQTEQCPMSENITNRLNFTILAEVNSRVTGIRVRAYTSVGPGPFAMTAPVTLTPSMVMNVRVESLTDTSVIVTWDRITDSPEIAEYIVYYAPVSSSRKRQDNEQSVTVPSNENSVEISGLESTVEYQYQVTAVALVFGGLRLEGERSPVTDNARLAIMEPKESNMSDTSDVTVAVSVSVVVTFLLTIILNNAVLLIGYKVCAHHYKRSQDFITAETSGIELKENAAYGPVTSSQQPQDYIYAQPDTKTEGDYDVVK